MLMSDDITVKLSINYKIVPVPKWANWP